MEVTQGHLLGGRVRYAQPRSGFRSGIEPVLLAAAVPARPGERVLEAGSGAGAALGAFIPDNFAFYRCANDFQGSNIDKTM